MDLNLDFLVYDGAFAGNIH